MHICGLCNNQQSSNPNIDEQASMQMSLDAVQEHVQVVVRARPIKSSELNNAVCLSCSPNGKSIQINSNKDSRVCLFTFDGSFDGRTTQEDLYERCNIRALVKSAFAGYNTTIFTFGQTGAGKTYTTLGPSFGKSNARSKSEQLKPRKDDGVLSRAIHDVFSEIENQTHNNEIQIWVSCFEMYNESITDLLNNGSIQRPSGLPVRYQSDIEAFVVDGLIKVQATTQEDAFRVLSKALCSRQTRANSVNNQSSRSHCITTLHVQSMRDDGKKLYGKFSVVDLAGSERLKSTKSFDRRAIKETRAINKSLFTLGQVLWAVRCSSRGRPKEAPYRESKLTQLLWDSIRGSSKTLMIACCTPFQCHIEETLNTLKYASTAIRIKSTPRVMLDPREQLIEDLQNEIKRLRNQNTKLTQTVKHLQRTNESQFMTDYTPGSEDYPRGLFKCSQEPRLMVLDHNNNNKEAETTPRSEFQIESFPELDSLEEEFHNNLLLQDVPSRSSRSSQLQTESNDGSKIEASEKSSNAGLPLRKSPGSCSSQAKESVALQPKRALRGASVRSKVKKQIKRSENEVSKREDFRTKIIEDLNRTKAQIQKQRQQLMSKLQNQINMTRDWV